MDARLAGQCLVAGILATAAQPALAERGNPRVALDGKSVDTLIADFMQEHRIPGMTLAIVQAPYISRVVGYGVVDVDSGLLASPKTLWNVGQMSRAYTAVAIFQLVEAQKLSLDDPLRKYLPEVPASWQSITLRHLLAHASGLPDYTRQSGFDPARDYRPGELLDLVKSQPVAFPPGTQTAPSATDFFLLALVVEKTSGMSYEEFVTRNQFELLKLKNTAFASRVSEIPHETLGADSPRHKDFLRDDRFINPTEWATGYSEKEGKLVAAPRNSSSAWAGHGSVLASAEDISFWDIGLAGNLLVTEKEHRDYLYHGVKLADGTNVPAHCGWRFPGHKGLMDIEGHVPGFSCYLSRFTDKSELLCVTLCANKEGVDLAPLARRIAGAFDRKLAPPAGPAGMVSRESCYDVTTTANRLEAFIKSKKVNLAARINHAAAAKEHGLGLPPTEVLVFGNPAVGTKLMQSRPSLALDLPLRMLVWQESDGTVWVGYHDVEELARQHGLTDQQEVVAKMREFLAAAARQAVAPY